MNMTTLDTAGHHCLLFEPNAPQYLLIQLFGGHEQDTLATMAEAIATAVPQPFAMAAVEITDWERELMPWGKSADTKETDATGTLHFLQDDLLPLLTSRFGTLPAVLGGYSLAGLFALWAARETNAFTGVAAASPSVWIQDWPNYTAAHPMQARQVYLSLGKREEQTRNRVFAQVGDRIRGEYALLQRQLGDAACTLVWNDGGHFVDCDRRMANAFIWNLLKLTENSEEHKAY